MKRKHCYVLCGLGIALLLAGCGNTSQTMNQGTEMIVMESQSQEMEESEAQSEENEDMAVTEETETKNETETETKTETEQETENTEETTVNNQSVENKPDTASGTSNKPSEEQKPENQTTQETPQQKPEEQTPQTPTQETPSEPVKLSVKDNLKMKEAYADYCIISADYVEMRYYFFYDDGTYWTCFGGYYPESVWNTFQDGFDESMRDYGLEVNGIIYYQTEGGCCWDGTYSVTDEELIMDNMYIYKMNEDGNLVDQTTGRILAVDGSYDTVVR